MRGNQRELNFDAAVSENETSEKLSCEVIDL